MINITKLLYNVSSYGDELRYKQGLTSKVQLAANERKPIVVWNTSRQCNLSCIHCYSDSHNRKYSGEVTTEEARKIIQDLAAFKVPVLLFSGGEPLLRKDIFALNALARSCGLRTVISTNGTLITKVLAEKIKREGFDYVGVSLDGIGKNNDRFRGRKGAFARALAGIRNLVAIGQKTGLRFTITRHNYRDVAEIFKLVEDEFINRVCFYHLVYSGRGSSMARDDLTHFQMRRCIDALCEWTGYLHKKGLTKEVLTVDNHADGPYIYLKMKKENSPKAEKVLRLLQYNGGNSSGIGIASIDSLGNVHADQFWQSHSFGNARIRAFGDIWQDTTDSLMAKLKDRKKYLKGRCAMCKFLDICNGNFRVRAEAVYKDAWQQDPACYLTDEEIAR